MKSLLILGGLVGFSVGLLFSWAEQSAWPASLWHACLAAYVTGFLMRWWGTAWQKNLHQALRERQVAQMTATSPVTSPSKTIKS